MRRWPRYGFVVAGSAGQIWNEAAGANSSATRQGSGVSVLTPHDHAESGACFAGGHTGFQARRSAQYALNVRTRGQRLGRDRTARVALWHRMVRRLSALTPRWRFTLPVNSGSTRWSST